MYSQIAVLKFEPDNVEGGAKSVRLGFFDDAGICQLEVPQVSGKLFPKDIRRGQSIKFCNNTFVKIEEKK